MARKNRMRAIVEFKNAAQATLLSAEPQYQLGMAYLEAGGSQSGVACLTKATELSPQHVGAQIQPAQAMATSHKKKVLEEAERRAEQTVVVLKNSVSQSPEVLQRHRALAEFNNLAKRTAQAEGQNQQTLGDQSPLGAGPCDAWQPSGCEPAGSRKMRSHKLSFSAKYPQHNRCGG